MGRDQLYCGGFRAARLAQDLEQLISQLICVSDRPSRNGEDTDDRCRTTVIIHDRQLPCRTFVIDIRSTGGLSEQIIEGDNADPERVA